MVKTIGRVFLKSLDFGGRSSRREFVTFFIFTLVMSGLMIAWDLHTVKFYEGDFIGPHMALFCLVVWLPSWALTVRRFHDGNSSGWLCLLGLIPVIGTLIQLLLLLEAGDTEVNDYGPVPVD
ncbi:DUF805 domain-containing protein [Pseudomonas syringae]|nr:DUF805 domain-containing protein [Pseudomonas syringae]